MKANCDVGFDASGTESVESFDLGIPVQPVRYVGQKAVGAQTTQVGDLNGDGFDDIVTVDWNALKVLVYPRAVTSPPDVLTSITNGALAETTVTYSSTSDASVYKQAHSCKYPYQCLRGGLPVVSSVAETATNSDGTYGARTYSYGYESGVANPFFGFLEFARRTVTDQVTGAVTTYDFADPETGASDIATLIGPFQGSKPVPTLYRFNGLRSAITTVYADPGDHVFRGHSVTFSDALESGSPAGSEAFGPGWWFVYPTQKVESDFDGVNPLTEQPLLFAQVTTKNVEPPNHYGSPVAISSSTGDGYVTSVSYEYGADNPGSWIIGHPTLATMTSTAPDGSSKTRTNRYSYDQQGMGLLVEQVRQPDATDNSETLDTTYGRTDPASAANITSVSLKGWNGQGYETRTSSTTYGGADHAFPESKTDPMNLTTSLSVDQDFGFLYQSVGPSGIATQTTRDTFGTSRSEITYGRDGSVFSEKHFDTAVRGSTSDYEFELQENVSAGPPPSRYTRLDRLGRAKKSSWTAFDGTLNSQSTTYDLAGRLSSKTALAGDNSAPGPNRWTYLYDVESRLNLTKNPDGTTVQTKYGQLTTTVTDEVGNVTTTITDQTRSILRKTQYEPAATDTFYSYGPFHTLASATDPGGHVTSFVYDDIGRTVSEDDPDRGASTIGYDSFGEVIVTTRGLNGAEITNFGFDADGRTTYVNDYLDGATNFTWDTTELGSLTSVSSPDGVETNMLYDSGGRNNGRQIAVNSRTLSSSQTYDQFGRPLTTTLSGVLAGSSFTYKNNYTSTGYVSKITSEDGSQTYWGARSYAPDGQVLAEQLGGVSTNYKYDPIGRLRLQSASDSASGEVLKLAYDYYGNGRPLELHPNLGNLPRWTRNTRQLEGLLGWSRHRSVAVIDVTEFERLQGIELAVRSKQWANDCDESFVRYFLARRTQLDPFHFRVAVTILGEYDSEEVRRLLRTYVGHSSVDILTAVNAYFFRQVEKGFVRSVPDGVR